MTKLAILGIPELTIFYKQNSNYACEVKAIILISIFTFYYEKNRVLSLLSS